VLAETDAGLEEERQAGVEELGESEEPAGEESDPSCRLILTTPGRAS
jgi:hypothetical protein